MSVIDSGNVGFQTQRSHYGPFKSSGGSFYMVCTDVTAGFRYPRVYSASDPTSTWTREDSTNEPALDAYSGFHHVFQDGDDLHMVYGVSTNNVHYSLFDMSTDTLIDGVSTRPGGGSALITSCFHQPAPCKAR